MIGALVLAAAFAGTLPDGAARYRLEIGGEVVGACALSLRCAGETCRLRWETRLRLPRDAGGAVSVSAVELDATSRLLAKLTALDSDQATWLP